jgi:hypothetical protein
MSKLQLRRVAVAGAAAATLVGVAGLYTTAAVAHADSRAAAPVVDVTVTNKAITFSGGSTLQAGTSVFDVTSKGKSHTLQIIELHKGYSIARFKKDIRKGVERGSNVHSIRRLDHKVTWLGGTSAPTGKTREFATTLAAGKYIAFDQNGPAHTKLKVTGSGASGAVPTDATATGTSKDRWKAPKTLPADGWVRLRNTSDESHFFALQGVKESTTRKDVRDYIKAGAQGAPKWIKGTHVDSGVFSHRTNVAIHVHLPAGKYLLACFWPSKDNGMPHFAMGMWKLVHLK